MHGNMNVKCTHSQFMHHFLFVLARQNGYVNAPEGYVIRTLRIFITPLILIFVIHAFYYLYCLWFI